MSKKRKKKKLEPTQLILFFSGSSSGAGLPERVLADQDGADLMLTYYEINQRKSDTTGRFTKHAECRKKQNAND